MTLPGGSDGKESACNARDRGNYHLMTFPFNWSGSAEFYVWGPPYFSSYSKP